MACSGSCVLLLRFLGVILFVNINIALFVSDKYALYATKATKEPAFLQAPTISYHKVNLFKFKQLLHYLIFSLYVINGFS